MTRDGAPALDVESLEVAYGGTPVLRSVSLRVQDGEFLTLLGPSGCGKTTLLRSVAGFVRPDAGTIRVAGEEMGRRPAHRRPVNTVFQRPTLLPHLNALENVALGLRLEGMGKAERRRRAGEMLELVHLGGYERRRPHEMSGGQQQRVALARALAKRPRLLLLDEPLSALDLAIRLGMEEELRRLHRETGAAFVYVTHDQREALALSDRIAVLCDGVIDQLATPAELYRQPTTPFVARFVGNANVLDAVTGSGDAIGLQDGRFVVVDPARPPGSRVWLVLRPEFVRLIADGIPATVEDIAFRGTTLSCRLKIASVERSLGAEIPAAECSGLAVGDDVRIGWDPAAAIVLSRADGQGAPSIDPVNATVATLSASG